MSRGEAWRSWRDDGEERGVREAGEGGRVREGQRRREKDGGKSPGGRGRRTEGRRKRRERERGRGPRGVSMATRRGGNATVTMAAAGSSLGPTCLSLFLLPRPPPPPRVRLALRTSGPLLFAHGFGATTDPQRREREKKVERAHKLRSWTSGYAVLSPRESFCASFLLFSCVHDLSPPPPPPPPTFFSRDDNRGDSNGTHSFYRYIVPDKPRYRLVVDKYIGGGRREGGRDRGLIVITACELRRL